MNVCFERIGTKLRAKHFARDCWNGRAFCQGWKRQRVGDREEALKGASGRVELTENSKRGDSIKVPSHGIAQKGGWYLRDSTGG